MPVSSCCSVLGVLPLKSTYMRTNQIGVQENQSKKISHYFRFSPCGGMGLDHTRGSSKRQEQPLAVFEGPVCARDQTWVKHATKVPYSLYCIFPDHHVFRFFEPGEDSDWPLNDTGSASEAFDWQVYFLPHVPSFTGDQSRAVCPLQPRRCAGHCARHPECGDDHLLRSASRPSNDSAHACLPSGASAASEKVQDVATARWREVLPHGWPLAERSKSRNLGRNRGGATGTQSLGAGGKWEKCTVTGRTVWPWPEGQEKA